MVVSLVVPAVSAAEVPLGLTLMFAGLMFQSGVAEMLDSRWIRLAITLRFVGAAIVVVGLMLQLL